MDANDLPLDIRLASGWYANMMPRYAAKRDAAEAPIIKALESVGAEVWALDYPVDLLVRFRCGWYLLEVKTPHGKRGVARLDKRQQAQQNFIASTGTPIVKTPLEALRAIGAVSEAA